ncbi:MAG: carboxypeptidase regulatory-like domain-containing protein [Bacteroidota bacterium]
MTFKNIKTILVWFVGIIATPTIAQTTTVSGNVQTAFGAPATNVEIMLAGDNFTQSTTVDSDGNYEFTNVPINQTFSLDVVKEDNAVNGVSTFDLVIGAQHILGVRAFDNNAAFVAMDANGSGNVTAFDLIQIRRLVLGITSEFPNSPAWRIIPTEAFEDADFIRNEQNEFPSMESFETSNDPTIINFTAIKIGDANGNALP